MNYRSHRNLKISEIGVGCYALSGAYGTVDPKEFQKMLRRAYELGVNFFDTAEGYGNAEEILGETVKPFRDDVLLATKVGIREGIKPNLSKEYIEEACQLSLQNLKTDYIDLYQVHFDDPKTPVKETVAVLDSLVDQGKIRYYGVGHLPKDRVHQYCEIGTPFSILMELSAVSRESRENLLPFCDPVQTAGIAFSTTGRGVLSGKYGPETVFEPDDIRNVDPLFQGPRFQSALVIADKFSQLGKKYGKTSIQVAIAWVLAQPNIICALTGSTKINHMEENLGGSGWSLSQTDLVELNAFFEKEQQLLVEEEKARIEQILTTPLPKSPAQAFINLVYVLETSHNLDLLDEQRVRQIFQELWLLQKTLDEAHRPQLEAIQKRCKSLIYD